MPEGTKPSTSGFLELILGYTGSTPAMAERTDSQEKALLAILIATGERTIEAFHATGNPVDAEFLVELERIIERSRQELATLAQKTSA